MDETAKATSSRPDNNENVCSLWEKIMQMNIKHQTVITYKHIQMIKMSAVVIGT